MRADASRAAHSTNDRTLLQRSDWRCLSVCVMTKGRTETQASVLNAAGCSRRAVDGLSHSDGIHLKSIHDTVPPKAGFLRGNCAATQPGLTAPTVNAKLRRNEFRQMADTLTCSSKVD